MTHLFWIDLEMTGLNIEEDCILEVAVVITNMELNPVDEYHAVAHQPQEVLDKMNDWCKKTHGESGLTEAVKTGTPLEKVEDEVILLIDRHFEPHAKIVLCGNSVWNDRLFIEKFMPKIAKRLHYRMIDVSSFKEIFREKYGIKHDKKGTHRALDDIHESMNELKKYLSFIKAEPSS